MRKYRIVKEDTPTYTQYRAQKRSLFGFWYSLRSSYSTAGGCYSSEEKARQAIESHRRYKRTVSYIDV